MQKNVEYIVLEKINRCADCGRRLIGKTGVNPAQSRYCKGKFTAICHWETGKAQLNVEPEPGDLPVTGILHLREIGGYLHRLFIYALSREGIFILKGGLRMYKEMILVTGGARSGKSEFAERFVLHYGSKCAYIATAEIFDDEMTIHHNSILTLIKYTIVPLAMQELFSETLLLSACTTTTEGL